MNNKGEIILYLIVLVVLIAILLNTVTSCDGTLVRGLFWFECIKGG